jgi:hypothetical protein
LTQPNGCDKLNEGGEDRYLTAAAKEFIELAKEACAV